MADVPGSASVRFCLYFPAAGRAVASQLLQQQLSRFHRRRNAITFLETKVPVIQ